MVELHGWATIREHFFIQEEDENIEKIVDRLKQEIEKLGMDEAVLRMNYSNGSPFLTAAKSTNHFRVILNRLLIYSN